MSKSSRRTFLASTASVAIAQTLSMPSWAHGLTDKSGASKSGASMVTGSPLHLDISIDWNRVVSSIPADMLGLSYESYQLSAPDFFSAANTELIALFGRLSPSGVLRLGGNLSEFTVWAPDHQPITPAVPFLAIGPDPSSGKKIPPAQVTPQAIQNLRDFLDAAGWRAVYGLNLARANSKRVAAEARYVASVLGPRLIAFQIGNEPDHYVMNGLRPSSYSFRDYFGEWTKVHSAVQDAVPSARFAGPDVAEDVTWVEKFADAAPESVTMLTGHRYAEGPPSDPSVTLDRLLAPNPLFMRQAARMEEISRDARIPYVMAETNSCFKAGKEGVSDVFGAALWAVDYFLQLAASGEQGVYFHGGASGWYTPIAGGSGRPFEARPIYYGLQMCRELLKGELVAAGKSAGSANVSVYALRNPRKIVIVNKGSEDSAARLAGGEIATRVVRLFAPSVNAKTGIVLTEQSLAPSATLVVPKYSAAVFELQSS